MNGKLNVIHSFWSKPKSNGGRIDFAKMDNEYADLLCCAVSVAFCKRNELNISLYTDGKGAERYGWLPYGDVVLCLDNHDFEKDFWASGKIVAQEHAPIGAIHIDMDVFLKTQKAIDAILAHRNKDLIVQNREFNYENNNWNKNAVAKVLNLLGSPLVSDMPEIDWSKDIHAYCCGLLGFSSENLKQMFIAGYKRLYEKIITSPEWENQRNSRDCIDLLTEQAYLYSCANYLKSEVGYLFGTRGDWYAGAREIDYAHLIHTSKYQPSIIARNEEILKEIAPEIHKKIVEHKN